MHDSTRSEVSRHRKNSTVTDQQKFAGLLGRGQWLRTEIPTILVVATELMLKYSTEYQRFGQTKISAEEEGG